MDNKELFYYDSLPATRAAICFLGELKAPQFTFDIF
jgi:hypothetical protein